MARMSKALMVDNISRHAISDPGALSLFVAPIFLKTFFFGHYLIFFQQTLSDPEEKSKVEKTLAMNNELFWLK